jgi:hypothetical protein
MNGELYFDMAPKLNLAKYEVNLVELGGKVVKLINLIDQAVTKGLILYHNINFLLYSLNTPAFNTKFFNLFLGFLAKPMMEINKEIMDPILWHILNIICDKNKKLNEYIWNWWTYNMSTNGRDVNKSKSVRTNLSKLPSFEMIVLNNVNNNVYY